MKVEIKAFMKPLPMKECIKEAALDAVVDETVRLKGSFVSELFHPGPWERFKRCTRPRAEVELSAGGLFIARGEDDYLDFAEAILSIGALARGKFGEAVELAELTGTRLRANPEGDGIKLSFAGFYGLVKVIKGNITFSTDETTVTIPIDDFLKAEQRFLDSLPMHLGELFDVCSKHGLERAFVENTRALRFLLKVVGYENRMGY